MMVIAVGDTPYRPTGTSRESYSTGVADSLRPASTKAPEAAVGVMRWSESCKGGDVGNMVPQLHDGWASL